jgi:hypothetical protein
MMTVVTRSCLACLDSLVWCLLVSGAGNFTIGMYAALGMVVSVDQSRWLDLLADLLQCSKTASSMERIFLADREKCLGDGLFSFSLSFSKDFEGVV